jgi:hypothetical protein
MFRSSTRRVAAVVTAAVALAGIAGSAHADTQTFTTPGETAFTVPAGVYAIQADVVGAPGGTGGYVGLNSVAGGNGGFASGRLSVEPGSVLYVEVGAPGASGGGTRAFNGGGAGITQTAGSVVYHGGGGGGASDLRTVAGTGAAALGSRVLVAGGGGGGGVTSVGGAAGRAGGGDYPGQPGTLSAGGAGGFSPFNQHGQPGTFGVGGDAGSASVGGGGGGYYGGGGGGAEAGATGGAGGGGGSNFAAETNRLRDVRLGIATSRTPSVTLYYGQSASVSASTLAFPDTTQASVSASRTVTVTNTGAEGIGGFAFAGAHPDDFFVSSDTCRGIGSGESCTVTLRFTPQATGARSATFTVNGASVTLSGTGTPPLAGPQGATGATGPQGDVGRQGPAGAAGPQGPVGETGPQGERGEPGPVVSGSPGAKGEKGDKGDPGPAGAQGPVGRTGPRGTQGRRGAPGPIVEYRCHPRQGTGDYPIACFVAVKRTGAKSTKVSTSVRRGSVVYARGERTLRAGQQRVPLVNRRNLTAGRYELTVRIGRGQDVETYRTSFRIG